MSVSTLNDHFITKLIKKTFFTLLHEIVNHEKIISACVLKTNVNRPLMFYARISNARAMVNQDDIQIFLNIQYN